MEDFDKDIVSELNNLRTNPQSYIDPIREYKNYFHNNNILKLPGAKIGIQTSEGASAYEEAAIYLKTQKSIPELKCIKGLCKVAEQFLNEIQKSSIDKIGEIDMEKIIKSIGTFSGSFSRAIDFGGTTPALVVSNLLVSDGDETRGQRNNIFNEDLKYVGIAHGEHKSFELCTVIVTCTQFISNDKNDDEEIYIQNNKEKFSYNDDNLLPPGVKSLVKSEKVIVEGGKKKKLVKITKLMEDGSTQVEIEKETID